MRQEVKEMFESLSLEEFSEVGPMFKETAKRLTAEAMSTFRVDDRVTFLHPTHGRIVGTVQRVNKKTLSVVSNGDGWRVCPSLCTKVD